MTTSTDAARCLEAGRHLATQRHTAAACPVDGPPDRCPVCHVSGMQACVAGDDRTEVPDHAGRPVGLVI